MEVPKIDETEEGLVLTVQLLVGSCREENQYYVTRASS